MKKLTILKMPIPVGGGISLIKTNVTPISYEDEAGNVISGNNLAKRLNEFRPHRNFHHYT